MTPFKSSDDKISIHICENCVDAGEMAIMFDKLIDNFNMKKIIESRQQRLIRTLSKTFGKHCRVE